MRVNVEELDPLPVTINEAIELLGIGRTNLYALIDRGHLEVVTIGRRTLVKYESLKRLAQDGC